MFDDAPLVPSDMELDQEENRITIITGPGMAGKPTYVRQIALVVLMTQIGHFVSAQSAGIGVVDTVLIHVGASNDVASG